MTGRALSAADISRFDYKSLLKDPIAIELESQVFDDAYNQSSRLCTYTVLH